MATPAKEEIPARIGLSMPWVKYFKEGLRKSLCGTVQPKTCTFDGLTFLKVISWIQLVLGFLCICLALIGVAAAFEADESAVRYFYQDLTDRMEHFHRSQWYSLYEKAEDEKGALHDKINAMEVNCPYAKNSNLQSNRPMSGMLANGYRDTPSKGKDFQNFCMLNDCYPHDNWLKGYHLIVDFLATPSWTGIALIITSIVGFRLVSFWGKPGFIQVSHSHIILNTLCFIIFAPLMITAGVLQMVFTSYWRVPFRYSVGKTTVVFGSFVLMLSLMVCIINCCCPISFRKGNNYEKLTDELATNEKEKEETKDDAVVVFA